MRTALLAGMARGSVSRRSGGWCFRLDAGVRAATGRRHQVSRQAFATKRDAVAALNTALTELNATTSEAVRADGGTFERLPRRVAREARVCLHDLRHTYAALALRLGTHPVLLLSERLGHTSIAVTIDRYSHVIPSIDRHAADVVAQHILPSPG